MADFLVSETETLDVEHDTTWELFFDFILKEKSSELTTNATSQRENKISDPRRTSSS
ncbi:MAG: hypothetical protein WC030_01810 [Candidatus Paceibacterota bacterium]